jgi:alpha-tubulin suppressor-like RCC1 family protein
MTTGFKIKGVDWDDKFVRRDIFTEGGLWVWGDNGDGGLGDNTVIHRSSPVQTVAGGTNWKQAFISGDTSSAIKTDGTLWMWGYNLYGQLGTGNRINRSSPVQTIAGGTNWKTLSMAWRTVSAIKTDGTLWVWGYNEGELGDGTLLWRSSPVQTVAGGTDWKMVSSGISNMAAIKTDGTLWVWGRNGTGSIGDNTVIHRSSPVQTVAGGTNWKEVYTGAYSVAGIKTDGTLWLWGSNYYGELGNNTLIYRSSPVQTIAGGTNWKKITLGYNNSAAIKTDGTLWTWGSNYYGELGDGYIIHRSSPVQTISGGTNWKKIVLAKSGLSSYFAAAIKTDGTLWTWGRNDSGQLGDSTRTDRSSPVQTIAGGNNWKDINAMGRAMGGIREDYYN